LTSQRRWSEVLAIGNAEAEHRIAATSTIPLFIVYSWTLINTREFLVLLVGRKDAEGQIEAGESKTR